MATEHDNPKDRSRVGLSAGSGEMEFDQEIRRRLVFATGMGILALTVVSMVLMWWLSGFFVDQVRSRDLPLTEVQEERRQQLVQENILRAQMESRVFPLLEFPGDASYPGGLVYDHDPFPPDPDVPAVPVVQVAPWIDMEAFLQEQRRIQESVGWDDPEGDLPKAHLPVEQVAGWFFADHEAARADHREQFPVRPVEGPEPGTRLPGVPGAVEGPPVTGGEGGAGASGEDVGGSNDRSEESL